MITTAEEAAPQALPADAAAAVLPALLARHNDLLAVKDPATGRYVHVNAAMLDWLRRPADAVIGHTDAELFDPTLATALRAAEQTALAQPGPLVSEHRVELNGQRHDFDVLRVATKPSAAGQRWLCAVWADQAPERQRLAQLRAAIQQIEQQQHANESLRRQLADQALRDPASGLYTRAHFEDQLRREADLSTREHREFAVVFIELDAPTDKVGALGPAAQLRVLEAMGRLLRGGTRAMDASCRHDDRRFAVLLSGVGLATAHSRMEGLRRLCAQQIVVQDGREFGFSVSMGVASYPHTAHTQDDLLSACETALVEARRRGGNQVTLAAIRFEGA